MECVHIMGERRKLRQEHDAYPTPAWVTRRLLEESDLPDCGKWLEPAVGDGGILNVIRERYPIIHWHTCDIRPVPDLSVKKHISGDYLEWASQDEVKARPKYDVIITNPPFSLAMEFIQASLPLGYSVVMLLRVAFLESKDRNAWIRQNMPDYIYVLPNRQGGTSDGKTDNAAYGWFHWKPTWINGKLQPVTASTTIVLPLTPLEERKRDRDRLAIQRTV